jgi:hypothetical protein
MPGCAVGSDERHLTCCIAVRRVNVHVLDSIVCSLPMMLSDSIVWGDVLSVCHSRPLCGVHAISVLAY